MTASIRITNSIFPPRWHRVFVSKKTKTQSLVAWSPIADHFAHLSVFNYAGNNPIVNIDLHGLQGVKYYDANTNTTTFNLNVVMIVGTKGAFESDLSAGDKKMVEDALNLMFGGTHTDKSGEKFEFTFNISVVDFSTKEEKINKKGEVVAKEKPTEIAFREIGLTMKGNSQETTIKDVPSFPFLLTTGEVPGTDGGEHKTLAKVDPNGREGFAVTLMHEVLHHMLHHYSSPSGKRNSVHHSLGGGLGRPIEYPHINRNILEKLKQYVPDGKK